MSNSADDKSILFSKNINFDIALKLSPLVTICVECQSLFSGKNKKNNIWKYSLYRLLPSILNGNGTCKSIQLNNWVRIRFQNTQLNYWVRIKSEKYTIKVFVFGSILRHKWLTHYSLEAPKRVIGKQCRPRSDAAERGILSGSPLFANSSNIFSLGISKSNSLTYLKIELESSSI